MTLHRLFNRVACVLAVIALASAWQPAFAAQTVVVGTGNPDVDVPAVQAAVNQGGNVILKGHFSFNRPPTIQTALAGHPLAMVLVSKAVTISGAQNKDDERASIEGGTIPFYVEAPGASVTIQALRFIRPVDEAIEVYAVHGLTIANCKMEGGFGGIVLNTVGNLPSPAQPGHPENIFGRLLIINNEIDLIGGTALDETVGILVFSVGQSPDKEADFYVSGNKISNTTEPAINFRRIGGRVHVEGNVINTGPVSGIASTPEVIRVGNIGSYVIAHNIIHCEWPDPQAIGIGVFSQFAAWPMEHAVVMDNSVTMSPPPGITFGNLSAGIGIRNFARDNVVANNKIRGRAKAALAANTGAKGGFPGNNTFMLNRLDDFEPTSADIFIGEGVTDTLLLGQKGTVEDHGVNTVIVPLREVDDPGDRNSADRKER